MPACPAILQIGQWYAHGTTDDIGRWPVPGPECRKPPVLFYHITEDKKLLNIHGNQYPMLIKFFVSNDLVHMGEFILPAGGTGSRASEPDCHRGDAVLFVEEGPVTFFLTETQEAFDIQEEEAMFIPEGVQLPDDQLYRPSQQGHLLHCTRHVKTPYTKGTPSNLSKKALRAGPSKER